MVIGNRAGRPAIVLAMAWLCASSLPSGVDAEEAPLASVGPGGKTAWHFSNGPEFPGAAGGLDVEADGTLRLRYDFTRGGNYVAAIRDLDPPAALGAVSFRVLKPSAMMLALRATDSGGQTFQKNLVFSADGWRNVKVGLWRWSLHWGGADDGVFRPPVRAIWIVAEGNGVAEKTGEVRIAGVTGRAGRAAGTPPPRESTYRVTDFSDGEGFAGDGGTLQDRVFTADLSGRGEAALRHALTVFGHAKTLRLRVRGGTPGAALRLQTSSHFEWFERELGVLTGGPQTLEIPAPPEGWRYWGGENDGKLHGPVRLMALVVARGSAPAGPVRVELDGLDCVTNSGAEGTVRLLPRLRDTGALRKGKRLLDAAVTGWNLLDRPAEGRLRVVVRDWEERVVHDETVPWTLSSAGVRAEHAFGVALPPDRKFADAEFTFATDVAAPDSVRAGWALPLDDPGDASLRPESPWGMGLYLYRYPNSDDGHARMERAAAMGRAAGVKWSREEILWGWTEPRKGEYDFTFYDRVVETARRNGISVYGLLTYWSGWTKPYTEEGIEDYCRWARAVVARYKDRIKHWEVWNEPNIFFWSGPKELYPVLLKKAYAAIKAEDPEAKVLGCSTAGIDLAFIDRCLKAEAPFDILTIHPYRGSLDEAGFVRELRDVSARVGGRPAWITEMGWPTQLGGGVTEREQARLLAGGYLAAGASGAAPNVSWYDFRCDGDDPFYGEANFGAVRTDLSPKPAYRALATVCRTLAVPPVTPREGFGGGVLAVGDAAGSTAVWSPQRDSRVAIRVKEGAPAVVNLMGEPAAVEREGDEIRVTLRKGCPVFLNGGHVEGTGKAEATKQTEAPDELVF